MKKLKIILNCNYFYYLLVFLVLLLYIIYSNYEHHNVYKEFNNEKFVITNIAFKDYGVRLELKGKEKVLGLYYLDDEQINSFKSEYPIGSNVIVTGERLEISNNTVFNIFNYKKYLKTNEIYNYIKITSIVKTDNHIDTIYTIKNILLKRLDKINKTNSYVSSLIFANNDYLDEDAVNSYRENGINHLFAVSGLHIATFLFILGFFLNRFRINNMMKNLIFILFLLYFMFITNFSDSVMRASIFTILLIFNKLLNLKINPKNILLLTLFLICLNNPLALNNIGLLYSFVVTFFFNYFKKDYKRWIY